jgi:ABC-type nitrate/sulfonate/bicarbonate transport system permease component
MDPLTTLQIGLFAGFILGYALGTLMWFRKTPRDVKR